MNNKMSLYDAGLIFEGGGMRGAYTAGVIDALIEADINFTTVYGVSSGACHATTYLSKQFGRARKIIVDYINDRRYFSIRNFLSTGNMFGIKFLFQTLPHELEPYDYPTFYSNPAKFYVGAINVRTGKTEYLLIKDVDKEYNKLAATMALPIISRKVKIDGNKYLDGGISDSLPLQHSIDDGNKKTILVLTQDKTYRKKINKLIPLIAIWYSFYPKLVYKVATRHIRYNETLSQIDEEEKKGTVFVIRPKKPVTIGRLEKNKKKTENLYEEGYTDGKEMIPALRKFMES